jgi:hypothetical protein
MELNPEAGPQRRKAKIGIAAKKSPLLEMSKKANSIEFKKTKK